MPFIETTTLPIEQNLAEAPPIGSKTSPLNIDMSGTAPAAKRARTRSGVPSSRIKIPAVSGLAPLLQPLFALLVITQRLIHHCTTLQSSIYQYFMMNLVRLMSLEEN